ncbi:hypothetical protein [Alloyangia pacifica]|uniref:hypothetical protein n=1 Tax=Alloyangia pacifica TaxID=311180 RepID=UPI00131F247A|nr:hypothetical protein [Alloyangia pacifica]
MTKSKTQSPTETPGSQRPLCLVVLGSRPAGAEQLCGILQRLGCNLPAGASATEPAAVAPEIVALHDQIFACLDRDRSDLAPLPVSWQDSPVYDGFLSEAEALLRQQFHGARMPLLWEPRLALLVPFWSAALRRCGYDLAYLHIPGSARDIKADATLPPEASQLAWLRAALTSERATRGQLRAHVCSERLQSDWRAELTALEKTLGFSFPRNTAKAGRQVDAALENAPETLFQTIPYSAAGAALHEAGWLQQADAILRRWQETGEETADHAALDQLDAEFQRAAALLDVFIEAARHNPSFARRKTGVALSEPWQDNAPASEAEEGEVDDSARIRTLEFRLEQRFEELASLSSLLFEAETQQNALAQQLAEARQREQQAQGVIDAVLSSTAWKLTSPLRRTIDFLRGGRTS